MYGMKKIVLKILFVLETLVIVLELFFLYVSVLINGNTELLRECSPDGKYVLCITELGTPDFPYGSDHLEIELYESAYPARSVSFRADVRSGGTRAGYKVTWLEDGVQIALIGKNTTYYILPFNASEEGKGAKEDTASEDATLNEEETMQEHEPYISSREEVLSAREAAPEGMTQEQIDRLTENIKAANGVMERAYFYEDIFGKLADKDYFYM